MNNTAIMVYDTLFQIADDFATDYAAQAAETQGRTEKKALTIQKEMAGLCIRCGLLAHTLKDWLTVMTNRMLAPNSFLAGIDEPCYKAFCDMPPADREIVTPYVHGLYFMADQFLIPWNKEFFRAEAAGDASGIFELNLKISIVTRVLHAWKDWWQSHADELPALPPMSAMEELLHE